MNHVTVVKVGVEVRGSQKVSTVNVEEPAVVEVCDTETVGSDNVDSRTEGGTDAETQTNEEVGSEENFVLAQEGPDQDGSSSEYTTGRDEAEEEDSNAEVSELPNHIPEVCVLFILTIANCTSNTFVNK